MPGEVDVAELTRPTIERAAPLHRERHTWAGPTFRILHLGSHRPPGAWHPGVVNELRDEQTDDRTALEGLIAEWLPLPDVAQAMGIEVSQVRRLIEDAALVAIRRGEPAVRSVPAELLVDGQPAPHLAGTIILLRDGGFTDAELLTWLFTADETLPGRPIDQLRAGQRGEVRRRAQALAL